MGGSYNYLNGDILARRFELYWLNLSTSFEVENFLGPDTLKIISAPRNPLLAGTGTFFTDNSTLYTFGASVDTNLIVNKMVAFNTSTDSWQNVTVSGGKLNQLDRVGGLQKTIPSTGLSFFAGGWYQNMTGMTRFDASDPLDLRWENETLGHGSFGRPVPRISGGSMEYVRNGKSGLLVAIGGYNTTNGYAEGEYWPRRSMAEIYIYDIESSTWFTVNATNEIPSLRTDACIGVSASPDDSSTQIYLYGGFDNNGNNAFDDVYILSVPSFRWIKAEGIDNPTARASPSVGRWAARCEMWGERQMFVIGGNVFRGTEDVTVEAGCDSMATTIRLFDTASLTWLEKHNASARSQPYQVPKIVYDVIGGGPKGGATLKEPEAGWPDPALKRIFDQTVPRTLAEQQAIKKEIPSSTIQQPTPQSTSSRPSTDSGNGGGLSNVGIAGIVVSLLVVAAFFLTMILYLLRRRRSQREHQGSMSDLPGTIAHGPPEELPDHHVRPHEAGEGLARQELADASRKREMPGSEMPGSEMPHEATKKGADGEGEGEGEGEDVVGVWNHVVELP
ncbi:MAG: hypothetical protein M1837_002618 [Sclerophora amabilis]|nr:MAG: hypothetical protein M1837_002618 [Sclerophora amabilis]